MNKEKTFPLSLDYEGKHYEGEITPSEHVGKNKLPVYFRVTLGDELFAYLCCSDIGWSDRDAGGRPAGLINEIGNYIMQYYE